MPAPFTPARILVGVAVWMSWLVVAAPAASGGPPRADEPVPVTGGARRLPSAPSTRDYHAKYAIIVGINDYESRGQGLGNLEYAANDAREFSPEQQRYKHS